MNYHVFVVDKYTFKYHLEYMFAGTGAGDKTVPFLVNNNVPIHSTTERNLVGMIADVSKIRNGDKIIFYLQATDGEQGKFYGVFRATSSAFFDENDDNNFLKDKTGKALTFRIKIEPDCVYPIGVSEHDYLDSLNNVVYPYQMCWSLIYRKLKANRGCTMITDYEYESLIAKLKIVNNTPLINISSLSFDDKTFSIVKNKASNIYNGRMNNIDIKNRLLFKANKKNAFEVHLQAYIMQNFDKDPLKKLLYTCYNEPCWIGNEVSCGVGMQRIDVMLIQENKNDVYIKIVELKCTEPYMDIFDKQLSWYIEWVKDYVAPNYRNKKVHIIPCVIAQKTTQLDFLKRCQNFHQIQSVKSNNICIEPSEYISFSISSSDIQFQRII